jgi:hypothetical protein
MKTLIAVVVWIGLACGTLASPPVPQRHQQTRDHAQLPSEFMGEPGTIQQMRIGDAYWVPAHGLVIDKSAKCWINKNQKLDETTLHMIEVHRFHDKGRSNRVLYGVRIARSKLQGWMWKLGNHEGKYYETNGHLAVFSLDVSD